MLGLFTRARDWTYWVNQVKIWFKLATWQILRCCFYSHNQCVMWDHPSCIQFIVV